MREIGVRAGGTVRSGRPSSRWMSARLDELEEARHEIHDDVLVSKRTDERHGPIVSLAREGDDDAIDLFVSTIPATSSSPPSSGRSATSGRLSRVVVDETDHLDPVLWVLLDLARRAARHGRRRSRRRSGRRPAAADDHPSSDATERHQRDCQRPETDRPIEFGLRPVVQPATRPSRFESDEVDDPERLIRRRVIGAGVISAEAERSCKHEPQGQREEEQTDLDAEADMVSDRASIREGDRRHDERDGQAGHVRRSDRPAGVPASTMARPSADRRSGRRRQIVERCRRIFKKPQSNLPPR